MTLTSFLFLVFAAVTVLCYYLVPKRGQWIVLLIASGLFYAAAGGWYLPFILTTILTTYALARVIENRARADEDYLAAHKADMVKEERKAYKMYGMSSQNRNETQSLLYSLMWIEAMRVGKQHKILTIAGKDVESHNGLNNKTPLIQEVFRTNFTN